MKPDLLQGLFASPAAPAGTALAVPPAPTFVAPRRLKLWDLEDKLHCPVIGTCLSMEELRRFARRHDFVSDPRDEFALHVEAVNHAKARGAFAEDLQRHFERKYALTIKQFDTAWDEDGVLALWRDSLAHGEVAAPFWAVATHRHAGPDARQRAYADVHMLSHQVGAGKAADARRLAFLDTENAEQRKRLAAERRSADRREAALVRRVEELEAALIHHQDAALEAAALRGRLAAFENGQVVVDLGRRVATLERANQKLVAESHRVWELEKTLAASRAEATRFASERDQLAAECDALERMLINDDACEGECARNEGACHLPAEAMDANGEPRSVLCVGGRTALVAQYRQLAARLGIRLVHHDGGQEEALSRLPDMIAGADAVICPTDCVSHSAYYQLKNQCRRKGKPCLLFKGAGVSSFALALARLSAGKHSLPGVPAE